MIKKILTYLHKFKIYLSSALSGGGCIALLTPGKRQKKKKRGRRVSRLRKVKFVFPKPGIFSKLGNMLGKKTTNRLLVKIRRRYFSPKHSLSQFHLAGITFLTIGVVFGSYFTLSEVIIPRLKALTESTVTMPTDIPFNRIESSGLAGYDDQGGAVSVLSEEIRISTSSSWLNGEYLYKKNLTLKNLSASPLATISGQVVINTKELYDAGKLQSDCQDLRVSYTATESGSVRTEIPRSYSVPGDFTDCSDSLATTITFPVQSTIWSSGGEDSNYEIYYGNENAQDPGYGDDGFNLQRADGSTVSATLVCPFDGKTTCVDGETPSTQTGAIRYSGGKGALSFDGVNDYVTLPTTFNINTYPTIEFWAKPNGLSKSWPGIFGSPHPSCYMTLGGSGGGLCGSVFYYSADQWHHFAVVKDNLDLKVYVDGILSATLSNFSQSLTVSEIGRFWNGNTYAYPGKIDEVRISDTVRYTSNFTPQTTPFETDANTKLLLHFDENGDDPRYSGLALDSSGNGNHGTISGAKYVGGLVGADSSSTDTGAVYSTNHQGIFIEEGTTNLITNPSFENSTSATLNWGTNYFTYATASATFTSNMAKRNSAGPFAAGVMVQGNPSPNYNNDQINVDRGTQISGNFYQNIDTTQGSIVFWITPEWNGSEAGNRTIFMDSSARIWVRKIGSSIYLILRDGTNYAAKDISSWVAGNTYSIVIRWDTLNTIDGTNHVALSVNDDTTYTLDTVPLNAPPNSMYVGHRNTWDQAANAIIEGLTIYRRPLFDGTYGIDVGNGDEIAQIYNSGTGKDPTLITGSWDVVFALPTNASTGLLTTGTGNAWSHPHSSNLLYTSTTNTGGFMMNGTASTDGWNEIPWYKVGGASGVVAAYQPIGAASYTASKTNLANPGTYDATEGVAPTWDSTNGWNFDGTQWLSTGISGYSWDWSMIIKYSDWNQNSGVAATGAYTGSTTMFLLRGYSYGAMYNGNASKAIGTSPSGVAGMAGLSVYKNGVDQGDIASTNLFTNAGGTIGIGSRESGIEPATLKIQTLVYYDETLSDSQVANVTDAMEALSSSGTYLTTSALSSTEKIFSGGYKYTSTGANQGIYRSFTATSGGDYVLRALGHSDGTCSPQIKVTRADGTTEISHLNGTTTSTRTDPDVYIFTWESPAAEANQIQLLNTASSGTCYWHQVEVLSNLITNPSMETGSGDPWIPTGGGNGGESFGSMSPGDTGQGTDSHSGSYSLQFNNSASVANALRSNQFSTGTVFGMFGGWIKGNGTSGPTITSAYATRWKKSSGAWDSVTNATSDWKHVASTHIVSAGWPHPYYRGAGSGTSYVDDVYYFVLQNVSLTVSPSSQANSTENSGLRVDGGDMLSQPITNLGTNTGIVKFKFTPRHSLINAAVFSTSLYPQIINISSGAASNTIQLYKLNSTLRLHGIFNNTTVIADTGVISLDAGTTYDMEIGYRAGGNLYLKINGTEVATKTGVVPFSTAPTTVYFGNYQDGSVPYAGTFSNFVSLTPTVNATAPYYKFGSKSVKLVGSDKADEYTITATASANTRYTLSAYVYNGTSGAVGGAVDSTIAQLASGSAALTTTYTDMGGGWWRLTNTSGTMPAGTYLYGVQVNPGKTVYVDGVQLEQRSYITTYTDGSLGSGYSWSGLANSSTSLRTGGGGGSVKYATPNNITTSQGTVSLWLNRKYYDTFDHGWGYSSGYFTVSSGGESNDGNFNILSSGQNIACVWGASGYPTALGTWYHVVVSWDNVLQQRKCYVNTSLRVTQNINTIIETIGVGYGVNWSTYPSDAVISDLRIFDKALTPSEVTALYNSGLSTHSSGTESDDRYENATATYTSPVIDLGANGAWGSVPWNSTQVLNGGLLNYFTRTSLDNSTWSDWAQVSGSTISSDPRRYFQWKAEMSPNSELSASPVITDLSLSYVEDSTPPINPDETALGYVDSASDSATLTSGAWHNHAQPKFTWNAGTDDPAAGQSSSGIDLYHVMLTTSSTAIPSDNTGDVCYAAIDADTRVFTVGTNPANCVLSDNVYYLRMQTKDNSGNVADPVTLFTYKYDGTIPNAPTSVATASVGYQADNSFTFFWPAATDNGPSGVEGYEFKTGTSSGQLADWNYTTQTTAANVTAYQEGQNFFYVRTKDNAGNYSGSTSNNVSIASFYFNESAPTAPVNLAVTPQTTSSSPASSNIFSVTWDKPASYSGEISKYYYCVNCTPSEETMTPTTAAQTVDRVISSAALATQQGKNTLYLVAEDNNVNGETGHGNRNFEAYATTDFYASTTAPGAPTNLTISDASDRDGEQWRLTLAWKAATTGGSASKYEIHRSTDRETYEKVGEVTSTAYTDADLTQSQIYYYKVRAVDDANSTSIFSNEVSETPQGKYLDPPASGGIPAVSVGSSTATITWTTGRTTYGTVEYGKNTTYGAAGSETTSTANHSIKLTGLSPGTTYHYRVQALDDASLVGYDRADAYSADYTFTTLKTPEISEVTVTDQTLSSAIISWKTSSITSSVVEYGETTEYGSQVGMSTVASESAQLARITGLKHSTKYHFRVRATTTDDTDITSDDYLFETLTFPEVTAVVVNTDQTSSGTTAVIAWATNTATTSEVVIQPLKVDIDALSPRQSDLAINTSEGKLIDLDLLQSLSQEELNQLPVIADGLPSTLYSGELSIQHVRRVSGLTDGTLYAITLKGSDENGNQAVSEPIRYVTGADTRPPIISNLIIETPIIGEGVEAKAQAIISWETDEPSYGQVLWGAGSGTDYPQATEIEKDPSTQHVIVIRDLKPTTTYHLQVVSSDMSGNKVNSPDTVVVTPGAQQAAFDIVFKNLEDVFGFLKL